MGLSLSSLLHCDTTSTTIKHLDFSVLATVIFMLDFELKYSSIDRQCRMPFTQVNCLLPSAAILSIYGATLRSVNLRQLACAM